MGVANEQDQFVLAFIGHFIVPEVWDHFFHVKHRLLAHILVQQELLADHAVIVLLLSRMHKQFVDGGSLAIVADAGV